MLCLSRDLRACCAFFYAFCGAMAASDGSVSPEGALAARQLSAAAGPGEPLGSQAAAFSSVLPRAQHRCRPPPLASFRDIALGVRQELQKPSGLGELQDAPSRRFRAARLFHRCRCCQITTRGS